MILTNYHTIAGGYDIQVTFSDGTRVPGRLFATAPRMDLALVKVDARAPLTAARWGDSDKVRIGERVFARQPAWCRNDSHRGHHQRGEPQHQRYSL